ncbi:hypothetical protein MWU52_03020 [Jannaschia sp. S6380]|uniref:DUF6653 family protein n=1 Tax=Jannaschia sp. S6380 TaxID=2926408 RepID=UPI001FF37ECC|nr:DUF6653 family protein [Jannaschia sp. S6380]MCK0166516.1 hypothetical protein [Jannaschia sp. S6380]
MEIFAAAERLMTMDDRAWARHANPWSVWSRATTLPLIALAVWSRVWIGWWALIPVALALGWTWLNPRLFPPPRDRDTWPGRGTLGERVWLRRGQIDLPSHHVRAAWVLTATSAFGAVPLVWGLVVLDAGWTICGIALVAGPKLWFVDRMVWLHQDMTGIAPGTPILDPKGALP